MDLRLAGKTAFVTGGSAGIGLAIARLLVSEGVSVAVCGRDADRLQAACADLRKESGTVHGVTADVTEPEQLAAAVQSAADEFGRLDLLVANAGGSVGGGLLESSYEDWEHTYRLNVLHAAHAVRCATPHLEKTGGSVVIVSSISGWKPGPSSSYASAKAAEIHLAATLGQELGRRGIRVNAISPGSTLFPGGGWESFGERHPERMAAFADQDFPTGQLVDIQEVADVACFVLSPRASGINGANICVDGGQGRPTAGRFW
jgi:3-oxoacyl-[acyl-carrier protein] reductase